MRAFAEAWPDEAIVQGVLAQLPWYHQLALLDKLPGIEDTTSCTIFDSCKLHGPAGRGAEIGQNAICRPEKLNEEENECRFKLPMPQSIS